MVYEGVIILELRLMTDMSILNGVVWLGLVGVKGLQLSRDCLKPDTVNIYHTIGATLDSVKNGFESKPGE